MARYRGSSGAQVRKNGARLERLLRQGFENAMRTHLELVGMEADQLVPQDKGELKDSQFIDVNVTKGDITATIGYDKDKSLGYAMFVHEMPEEYNYTTPGTGPKFLERPFFALLPNFFKSVSKFTRGIFR